MHCKNQRKMIRGKQFEYVSVQFYIFFIYTSRTIYMACDN